MTRRPVSLFGLLAEIALLGVTVAALASFDRLFVPGDWFRQLAVTALVAHATQAVIRRMGWSLVAALVATPIVASIVGAWMFYPETTTFGLPTRTTATLLQDDLAAAGDLFRTSIAPTEPALGFVVMTAMAIWVIAFLADWAAFRVPSAFEACIPAAAMVVFVSIFGADVDRLRTGAVFAAAALTFALFHRVATVSESATWLGSARAPGARSLLVNGAAIGVVALLASVSVSPALPGADDSLVSLQDLGDSSSGGPRVVVSPLVDIRGRLVNLPDVEVFTVRSGERSYWRLTSLDTFDGAVWSSRADYSSASGNLPTDIASGTSVEPATQQFEIQALGAVWLPAAFQPTKFELLDSADETEVSYESTSGTLIVDDDHSSSNALVYNVESALPRFSADSLAGLPNADPADVERFLQLPDDFSEGARAEAERVVAGASNPYEQSLALQNYFRAFTYDLEVGSGHSSARIDDFLASRRGYCEQFAGSFAAMARSLGIPTRVAVGFTPGDVDPSDPTLFQVRGEHAHAWPEVLIPGAGWVAFEPTPGRGAPGALDYTGVEEQQDESGPGTTPTTRPAEDPDPAPAVPTPFDEGFPEIQPPDIGGAGATEDGGRPVTLWIGLVLAVAGAGALASYGWTVLRARRRVAGVERAAAGDPTAAVTLAWNDTSSRLGALGLRRQPSETPAEFSTRISGWCPPPDDPLPALQATVTATTYATTPPTPETAQRSVALAARAREQIDRRTSRWQRYVAEVRSVLPRR